MALRNPVKYSHYRGHQQTSAPGVEPITVSEVGDQLNVDVSGESDLIDIYIAAAREQCEEVTGRALITQSWKLTLDHWPAFREPWWDGVRQMSRVALYQSGPPAWVYLPRYTLQSVDSVTVYDEAGNSTAVTVADTFIVDTQQEPGRMVLKTGETWPVALQNANAIEIVYTAGYGNAASDVPAALRLALLQMVAYQFEHRGDGCSAEDAMVASGAKTIFDRFRSRGL